MKLCYMDTEIFVLYMKKEYIYGDITKETRSDTLHYESERPLLKGK